jgi:CIC family chloride channel protein
MPRWARIVQPAGAGLVIASIAVWFPQVTGAGYEYIDEAMHDQYVWQVLAVLAGLKILTTVTSFAAGTPGGLFAPTLFIGAMLGGAVCGATRALFPWFTGSTGAYALIGMGTMFAGLLRAPITSVFMIIEVSGNYSIVLPLMISNTIAYLVSRQYQKQSIFDALAHQDGIPLPSMEQQREMAVQRVEDAMRPAPLACRAEDRVEDTLRQAAERELGHAIVQARDGVWTLITTDSLRGLAADGKGGLALGSVLALATPLPVLHPDQPLDVALRSLGDHACLPVVHRADAGRLVGVVAIEDVLTTYRGVSG